MSLASVVHAEGEVVNQIPGQPWMYGIGAFVVLLLLLFLVTRLNNDR